MIWRDDPATAKQIALLRRFDWEDEELDGITKGEASDIISEEFEEQGSWRDEPASEGQLRYLDALMVEFSPRITKGEASDLIEEETA